MARGVSRRTFLTGGAATVLTTAVGASALAACDDSSTTHAAGIADRTVIPFEGVHQQGIVTPAPNSSLVVAFTCVAQDKAGLQAMFKDITTEVRFL
ncbi:MAG TPA: hypothetical protein VGM78_05060, partial [Ilumatobacteraceae bacterium]